MIDRDEFSAWLRLLETPGIGRASARALLARFGAPEAVLAASTEARAAVVGRDAALALAALPPAFADRQAAGLAWLAASSDEPRDFIVLGDPRYPPALLDSADPPLLLYARGRVDLLARPAIAIVGSRNATPQGLENARAFAAHLSGAGWVVVSGLALGIDGAAHEGALAAGGGTIAVVGTGLDLIYPARHRVLTERIAARGAAAERVRDRHPGAAPSTSRCATESSPGSPAARSSSRRPCNRARSSRPDSPSNAGRDVFAIPGSIHSPQSRGCHALIKQGAKLVDSAADVLDELAPVAAVATGEAARGSAADARQRAPRRIRCSRRSGSIRSASTRSSTAPARARPSWRPGCSISSCRAASPVCRGSASSASSAAEHPRSRALQRAAVRP